MPPEVKWLSYLTGTESWLYQIYASLENCRGLLEINKRMNNIHVVIVAKTKLLVDHQIMQTMEKTFHCNLCGEIYSYRY